MIFDPTGKRVWVAGHRGMVGAAVVRRLAQENCQVLTVGRDQVDLRRQSQVEAWLADAKPDAVVLAAATVGGIWANSTRPAEFIYDNLALEANVIHGAWRAGTNRLLFLGSSCIYPRLAPQPMTEEALLTSPLEPTNEWYAIAKIAGVKLCQAYRRQYGASFVSAMPTNLYGPGDNYNLHGSHVLPALIAKIHRAKVEGLSEVEIWGSGAPRREFLHVDDLADAVVHLLKVYDDEIAINVGTGEDVTIREAAEIIARVIGWSGEFVFDPAKPDGPPRKLLNVDRLTAQGWKARIGFEEGIADAYRWYLEQLAQNSADLRR